MTTINYPVVQRGPRYVIEVEAGGVWDPTDECVYDTRSDAETARARMRGSYTSALVIRLWDPVFFGHCVICGDCPDQEDYVYPSWDEVATTLAYFPGWATTAEQLVYCPDHAPDNER